MSPLSLCYLVNTKDTSPKLHLRPGGKVSARVFKPRRKMQQPYSRRPWFQSKAIAQNGQSSAHQPLSMLAPFSASTGMPVCSASKAHQAGLSNLPAFSMGPFWYLCSSLTSHSPLPAGCVLMTLLLSKLRHPRQTSWPEALSRPQLFHRNALASSKDRTRELKINKQKSARCGKREKL